jgi:hypothetical protein
MLPDIDPAHLILALFRVQAAEPGEFFTVLKVIIATQCPLMHCATCQRVLHPTFLIQPLIAAPWHARRWTWL